MISWPTTDPVHHRLHISAATALTTSSYLQTLPPNDIALCVLHLNHDIISDHRVLYCDIDTNTLFSVPCVEEHLNATRRKLQMSKPLAVTKYLKKLDELYSEHRIYCRLDDIVDSFQYTQRHEYSPLIVKCSLLTPKNSGTWKLLTLDATGPHHKVHNHGPHALKIFVKPSRTEKIFSLGCVSLLHHPYLKSPLNNAILFLMITPLIPHSSKLRFNSLWWLCTTFKKIVSK